MCQPVQVLVACFVSMKSFILFCRDQRPVRVLIFALAGVVDYREVHRPLPSSLQGNWRDEIARNELPSHVRLAGT